VLKKLQEFAEALVAAGLSDEAAVAPFERPEERQAAARLVDELRAFATATSVACGLEPLNVSLLVDGQYRPAIEFGNRGRLSLDEVPDAARARLAAVMAGLLRQLGGERVSAFTMD